MNRSTRVSKARLVKMLESGQELPLEYLLRTMRAPEPVRRPKESEGAFLERWEQWADDRLEAAKAAAPFCHPKLAPIEWKPPSSRSNGHASIRWDTISLEKRIELRDRIKALIDKYSSKNEDG